MAPFSDEEEKLFAVAPGRFVAERDALAQRFKAAGDAARAKAVKELRKPSSSLWALNQLAHHARGELEQLFAVAERLRAAEAEMLRGGDGAPYLQAGRDERAQVAKLVERASERLAAEGIAATPALARRIGATLHAAAIGPEEPRAQLLRGALREELDVASGFPDGDLAAAFALEPRAAAPRAAAAKTSAAAQKGATGATGATKGDHAKAEDAERARQKKEREEREAREAKRAALEQAARDAQAIAEAARGEAESARERLATDEKKLAAAEAEATRLRETVRDARGAFNEAQRKADQTRRAATDATRALMQFKDDRDE